MNTVDVSTAASLRARVGRLARFTQVFGHLSWQAVWQWHKSRMSYRAVSHMNDYLLRDIGLEPGDLANPLRQSVNSGLFVNLAKAYAQARASLVSEVAPIQMANIQVANIEAANDSGAHKQENARAA